MTHVYISDYGTHEIVVSAKGFTEISELKQFLMREYMAGRFVQRIEVDFGLFAEMQKSRPDDYEHDFETRINNLEYELSELQEKLTKAGIIK